MIFEEFGYLSGIPLIRRECLHYIAHYNLQRIFNSIRSLSPPALLRKGSCNRFKHSQILRHLNPNEFFV